MPAIGARYVTNKKIQDEGYLAGVAGLPNVNPYGTFCYPGTIAYNWRLGWKRGHKEYETGERGR